MGRISIKTPHAQEWLFCAGGEPSSDRSNTWPPGPRGWSGHAAHSDARTWGRAV